MSLLKFAAAATVFAGALAQPAGAQVLEHKDISAEMAVAIATTTIATCKANGYAVSSTVVGRNGEIIVQIRGDNTGPHTVENSFRKAYTARTFRVPSGEIVTASSSLMVSCGLSSMNFSMPARPRLSTSTSPTTWLAAAPIG